MVTDSTLRAPGREGTLSASRLLLMVHCEELLCEAVLVGDLRGPTILRSRARPPYLWIVWRLRSISQARPGNKRCTMWSLD